MSEAYYLNFGCKPNTVYTSPLEQGDHPELDTTPFLDQDGIQQTNQWWELYSGLSP